jgi:hypothetical protein
VSAVAVIFALVVVIVVVVIEMSVGHDGFWYHRGLVLASCSAILAAIIADRQARTASPDAATVFGRVIRGGVQFIEKADPDYAMSH